MSQIDMQKLEVAMKYIERIADGKNPVNNKPSKSPFPFECLSGFEYADDTSIAHFMNRLKGLALDPNVRGIGTKPVTDWLKRKGYLIDVQDKYTGKLHPEATELGIDFGLYMQERTSTYGQSYQIVMYSQKAQEFMAAHLEQIVNNSI